MHARFLTLWFPSSSFASRPTAKSPPRMLSLPRAMSLSGTWVFCLANSPKSMNCARWWAPTSSRVAIPTEFRSASSGSHADLAQPVPCGIFFLMQSGPLNYIGSICLFSAGLTEPRRRFLLLLWNGEKDGGPIIATRNGLRELK